MAIDYFNGAGASLGDTLVTCRPLRASGTIWYVLNTIGTDAASPAGKNDGKPLKTLKQALVNAADDDIIYLMDGHTETCNNGTDWATSLRVAIVGGGSAAGIPTVQLTCAASEGTGGIALNAAHAQLRNIFLAGRSVSNSVARVTVGASNVKIIGCYFDCTANDVGPGISISAATGVILRNTTLKSSATSTASQPESAVKLTGAQTGLRLEGLVLDGGAVGFSNFYAFDSGSNAITHLEGESVSLLNGADMKLASATTGWLNVQATSGGSRVDW